MASDERNPILGELIRRMKGEPGATFGRAEPPMPAPELPAVSGPRTETSADELSRKARAYFERLQREQNKPTDSK